MKNKLALLIEMLPWLSLNPGVSAKAIATHFGITVKDVMDLLQLAVFTGPGQFGGELVDIDFEDEESIFVSDAKGLVRPIRFTQEQAYQIVAGLNYLIQTPELVNASELDQLLGKLMRAFGIDDLPVEISSNDLEKDVMQKIGQAISTAQSVKINYDSATVGKISERIVDPKSVVIENNARYLKAWCHAALAHRLFRIDRILTCEITGKAQASLTDQEPAATVPTLSVKLAVAKRAFLELDPKFILETTNDEPDSFNVTMQVHDFNWIAREILASQGQIKVIEPVELVELISQKIQKWRELNKVV